MKQNSRKNETNQKAAASLEENKGNAPYPVNKSTGTPDNSADNAAASDKSDHLNEIARDPEGRPGSFGIDDF